MSALTIQQIGCRKGPYIQTNGDMLHSAMFIHAWKLAFRLSVSAENLITALTDSCASQKQQLKVQLAASVEVSK